MPKAEWPSVLPDAQVVNIVVLGDAGVGKTTLVRVFVSDVFTEDHNIRVVDPVLLRETLNNFKCPMNVRDTSSQLQDHPELLRKELEDADVAIVCFAFDQLSSFDNLAEYWLPNIEEMKPKLPVLLVGTKRELDTSPDEGDPDAGDEAFIHRTEPLLVEFRCVETAMRCSAKAAVEEVHAVFNQATHMVMYPVAPLYDERTDSITPGFDKALTRIFRIFDQNHDGTLDLDELGTFQQHTFGLKLAAGETLSVIDVIREERPHGVELAADGSYHLNEEGFKRLVLMFVTQNHPESAWSVLKAFHYNRDLELEIPEFDDKLPKADQSHVLSPDGVAFLDALFTQFSSDSMLSLGAIEDVFSVVPSGKHPFGPDFPFNTRCSAVGAIQREYWLQLWRMVAMVNAKDAMRAFYSLGFGLTSNLDATKALAAGPPRKHKDAKSAVRRCFVVGSSGVGKSTLVRHFLHGPVGLKQHPPRPTPEATHYVKLPPSPSKGEIESASVPEDVLAARPSTLVMTEFPAAEVGSAMDQATTQCDVMCFLVDPASADSVAFFTSAVDNVPDDVPCFVVSCQHGAGDESSRRLRDICDRLKLDVFDFVPRMPASQSGEIFQFAAALSPLPSLDNPQTESRLRRAEDARFWGRVKMAAVVGGGIVVASACFFLATSKGRRLSKRIRARFTAA